MNRTEAGFAITTLLATGGWGLGRMLGTEGLDDAVAGLGFVLICLGLFLQHRKPLTTALGEGASAADLRAPFRGLPALLQVTGALALYVGILIWWLER
ncbi:hypothetical protein [Pseudomarimonas salicorniae]|uniref:Uncharacterized protein n=1 Tax=Pseudomarimonas salicorniae TaxID=2933270 RepID=A0ABT0GCT3_9GAMM|nr:hypothetical protein [Lysobacter sp. CAU 1642]MCK7592343.1 hypothetical protein [Lysobacter sp. CAU 1642]